MIAIIDYGMGNLRSVEKALIKAGAQDVIVTSKADIINQADKLVMPGVGAIQEAMRELKKFKLIKIIKENIFKKPYLGICLGMQLLFEESEEGGKTVPGLGIFEGRVIRFKNTVRVPHMGWNNIQVKSQKSKVKSKQPKKTIQILKGIPDNSYFYFCHSYYCAPKDKSIIALTTKYGVNFTSAIQKENLFAAQFHPEKSQTLGLRLLENFVKL